MHSEVEALLDSFVASVQSHWSPDTCIKSRDGTDQTSLEALDQAMGSLAQIIHRTQHDLRAVEAKLGRSRNSHLKVIQLPADVLREIFDHIMSDPFSSGYFNCDYRLPLCHDALDISHVCSVWRETALEHPSMWTIIDCASMFKPCIELYLERSSACPLSISCVEKRSPEYLQWFSDICAKNLARIETLQTAVLPREHTWLYDSSAPLLQRLHLKASGVEHDLALFTHGTPMLRDLVVSGCTSTPKTPLCKNLTSFDVNSWHCSFATFVEVIIALFEECPQLKDLSIGLYGAIPGDDSSDNAESLISRRPPVISKLKRLNLDIPSATFARLFLSAVAFKPTDMIITIQAATDIGQIFDHKVLQPQALGASTSTGFMFYIGWGSMMISNNCTYSREHGRSRPQFTMHFPSSSSPFPLLTQPPETDEAHTEQGLACFYKLYPMPCTKLFCLMSATADTISDAILRPLLQYTSSIETLQLTKTNTLALCEPLLNLLKSFEAYTEGPKPWSRLVEIQIIICTVYHFEDPRIFVPLCQYLRETGSLCSLVIVLHKTETGCPHVNATYRTEFCDAIRTLGDMGIAVSYSQAIGPYTERGHEIKALTMEEALPRDVLEVMYQQAGTANISV